MSNNEQFTTAGYEIIAVGGISLIAGQATMANSIPVVIASDQTNQNVNLEKIGSTTLAAGQTTMSGSVPVVIASDQGPVQFQLQKIGSTTLAAGQTTMSGSIPVVLASDQTGIGTRTSPNIVQNQKRAWLQNGQMYSLSTGIQTTGGSAGNFPLAVFNPSNSGKNVLIFSICISANVKHQAYTTYQTSNPNFASSATPSNLKMGGAGSVTTCTTTATSTGIVGTGLDTVAIANTDRYDILTNETEILLPSGSANALIAWMQTTASVTSYAIVMRWIEY